MAGVAAVEVDVVARDGLVAPCVVGGAELLVAALVKDGDDAAEVVGEEVEDAVGLVGLLLVEHVVADVVEPPGDAALHYLLVVAEVVRCALQRGVVLVEPCAPPLVVGTVGEYHAVFVIAVVVYGADFPEHVVLRVELRNGSSGRHAEKAKRIARRNAADGLICALSGSVLPTATPPQCRSYC